MVISLVKQYFPDFAWNENAILTDPIMDRIAKSHPSIKEYLCYVLLDFALVDIAMDNIPAGRACM